MHVYILVHINLRVINLGDFEVEFTISIVIQEESCLIGFQ